MLVQTGAPADILPMSGHVQIRTPDLHELEYRISREGFMEQRRLAYIGRERRADVRISRYTLNRVQLVGVHLGANVTATSDPLEVTQILVPVHGYLIDRTHGGKEITVKQGEAVVHNPNEPVDIDWEPNTSCLSVRIPLPCLKQAYLELYGECLPERFRFRPALSLTEGAGRSLASTISGILVEIDGCDHTPYAPGIMNRWEDLLLAAFLRLQAQQLRGMLPGGHDHAAPVYYYVRRATDYMMANLAQPLTTRELTRAAGVSQRTLQAGFNKCYGMGPIGFLRRERLKAVHAELTAAHPSETGVGDVAAKWGFYHASHFTQQYRRQFGELPSATLGRRR